MDNQIYIEMELSIVLFLFIFVIMAALLSSHDDSLFVFLLTILLYIVVIEH